jgi:hypothetical protein
MTDLVNTDCPPVNGYGKPKTCAACDAANLLEAILAKHPESDVNALIRALAKILEVGSPYIRVARRLSAEQRNAVRRGERPLVVPRVFEHPAA